MNLTNEQLQWIAAIFLSFCAAKYKSDGCGFIAFVLWVMIFWGWLGK